MSVSEGRGLTFILGVFLKGSSPYVLRQGLSINPEHVALTSVVSQLDLEKPCFSFPKAGIIGRLQMPALLLCESWQSELNQLSHCEAWAGLHIHYVAYDSWS